MILFFYLIPIFLCAINTWLDMRKGESIGEYITREDLWASTCIASFIPFVGLLTLIITVPTLVFNIIKDIRK